MTNLDRKKDNHWVFKTPPGTLEYTMHVEEKMVFNFSYSKQEVVWYFYYPRCINGLPAMLMEVLSLCEPVHNPKNKYIVSLLKILFNSWETFKLSELRG